MKHRFFSTFFFLLLLFASKGQSQNLVPNSGFEDSVSCQNTTDSYSTDKWYSPTMGSPDYFLITQTNNTGCFDNYPSVWGGGKFANNWGYQLPHSGKGYSGFVVAEGSEFMAVQLIDSLKTGKKYCVNTYVSLANVSHSGLDLIQFAFSKNKITRYDTIGGQALFLDSAHADASNQSGNIIIDTANWVLISDTFIAQGGEKYMTIGNFDTAQTQYQSIDTANPSRFSYYYFDDFDVHCIDCNTGISSPPIFGDISLTPNPGNGNFQLKGNFPAGTKLQIFDMLGQKISEMEIAQGNQTVPISLSLARGIYLYHLDAGGQQLKTGKLVIQR